MKFSPSVNNGWGCFCAKQRLLKTGLWRVAEFDVEMMNLDFAICMVSTWFFISTTLWTRTLWRWFYVLLHVSNWKLRFWMVHDVFQTTFAWPTFSFETGMILLLEFNAPARCTSTNKRQSKTARYSGWQIAGHLTLVVFACWEKGVRARSSHRIWVWFACVFLQALSASPVLHGPQA